MGVKEAIKILHIIQSNLMVKLVQTFDEREIRAISGQIKALDMAIISLKEKAEQSQKNTAENTNDKQSEEAIKEVVKDYITATYGSIDNL